MQCDELSRLLMVSHHCLKSFSPNTSKYIYFKNSLIILEAAVKYVTEKIYS